jgi:hypothetical protein
MRDTCFILRLTFWVIDLMLFERLKEFEKYLARDQVEDRNLDPILKILGAYEASSTGRIRRRFREKTGFKQRRMD